MEEKICKNCQHFYQHYIRIGRGRYTRCECGHCVYPRVNSRPPRMPACDHFVPVGQ